MSEPKPRKTPCGPGSFSPRLGAGRYLGFRLSRVYCEGVFTTEYAEGLVKMITQSLFSASFAPFDQLSAGSQR
jgi:hypothetical protein